MNRIIRLGESPKRIISLVPSQTELLYYLGCGERVVGITKFCIHPKEWFQNKTRVGGTKNVDFVKIEALKPDLIIANKEENTKEDINQLMENYTVYLSDVFNVSDACEMAVQVGELVGVPNRAKEFVNQIKLDFSKLPKLKGEVLYFIWANPYMAAGPNTFIGHLIEALGFKNALSDASLRYVEISKDEIQSLNSNHILLSSEPFPFGEKHIDELKQFYKGNIQLVDGEMFSWYGSRMLKMKKYFEEIAPNF